MATYIVMNTETEQTTTHRTWRAAVYAASRMDPLEGVVEIIERDRDGERRYDPLGNVIERD